MTPAIAIWSISLAALLVALGFAVRQALRAAREVRRIQARVDGYAELPLLASLGQAGHDAERIGDAVERIDPLVTRARDAVAVIRQGPIPPDVIAAIVRIGVEVQNLREFAP